MSFLSDFYNVRTLSMDSKKDISQTGSRHIGKFTQAYPRYSSKTVSTRGALVQKRQLHSLARSGELPDEMPTKDVEIYSIEEIGKGGIVGLNGSTQIAQRISGHDVAVQAIGNVSKVNGDFRQKEIIEGWQKTLLASSRYSSVEGS